MVAPFRHLEWDIHTPEQVQWRLDGVSVTLLAYPFRHRYPYAAWRGLAVADARDVAMQKAYTVGRRAQARDYLDLHAALVQKVVTLNDLVETARATYGEAFSPRLFLQQLTYTQDVADKDSALALLVNPMPFDVIVQDLARQVKSWGQQRLRPAPSYRGLH